MIIKTTINGSPFEIEIADGLGADLQFEEGRLVLSRKQVAEDRKDLDYLDYGEALRKALEKAPYVPRPNPSPGLLPTPRYLSAEWPNSFQKLSYTIS